MEPEDKTQDTINVEEMTDDQLNQGLTEEPADAVKDPEQEIKADAKGTTEPTELELLQEQNERYKDQLKNKDHMIQRQGNELGVLRKDAYAPPTEAEKTKWKDRIEEGDTGVFDEIAAKAKDGVVAEQASNNLSYDINKVAVMEAIPDFEQLRDEIAAEALATGYTPVAVQEFKTNPFGSNPQLVIQLADQVRKNRELDQLRKENDRIKNNKDKVIDNATGKPTAPVITGASGGSGTEGISTLDSIPIHKMTDAQLDQALADNKQAAGFN